MGCAPLWLKCRSTPGLVSVVPRLVKGVFTVEMAVEARTADDLEDFAKALREADLQASPDALVLDVEMDGQKVRLTLSRIDPQSFRLVKGGFHWIQERPFNR